MAHNCSAAVNTPLSATAALVRSAWAHCSGHPLPYTVLLQLLLGCCCTPHSVGYASLGHHRRCARGKCLPTSVCRANRTDWFGSWSPPGLATVAAGCPATFVGSQSDTDRFVAASVVCSRSTNWLLVVARIEDPPAVSLAPESPS